MAGLLDEPPPRSEQTVERWAAPAVQQTKRLARFVASSFIAVAIVGAVIILGALLASPGHGGFATSQAITGALVSVFFIGVLPAMATRRIILRDARHTAGLVRDGVAYPGSVARHAKNLEAMNVLTIVWNEQGREVTALVNVAKVTGPIQSEVIVLAAPRSDSVAVVLEGQGLFIGVRRR